MRRRDRRAAGDDWILPLHRNLGVFTTRGVDLERLFRQLLFKEGGCLDPITYVGVTTLLIAVAALASAIPAWRAARADPAITLRAE